MEQPTKPAWRENPLALGALGILVMVLGYLATGFTPQWFEDDPEEARHRELLRANGAKKENIGAPTAEALRTAKAEQTLPLLWPGRIVFLIGLGVVIVAAVRWNRLAHLPDESAGHEEEAEEVSS
jgi:hypothetical protein